MAFIQRTNSPTWGGKRGKRWWYVSLMDSTNIVYINVIYIYPGGRNLTLWIYIYVYIFVCLEMKRCAEQIIKTKYDYIITISMSQPSLSIWMELQLKSLQVIPNKKIHSQLEKSSMRTESTLGFEDAKKKKKKTNELYHLESRWLATPISLGLSWPRKLNRHQNWELRQPSTYHY